MFFTFFNTADLAWIIPLIIWELVWKGLALWRAGRNDEKGWFVAILLINSAGIVPIAYLLLARKR